MKLGLGIGLLFVCGCDRQPLGGPNFDASGLWLNGACNPDHPMLPSTTECTSGHDAICQSWAEGVAIGAYGFSRCGAGHDGAHYCIDDGCVDQCGFGQVCASDTPNGPRRCINACNWYTQDPVPGINDAGFADGFDAKEACEGAAISFSGPCTPVLDQFCRDWETARTVNRFGHSRCVDTNPGAATCSEGDFCPDGTASCRCTSTLICPWGAVCYSDTLDGPTHCGMTCQP